MRRQTWLIFAAARLTATASFFLLRVVHFDDVAVNRHLAKISPHVLCTELFHLRFDEVMFVFRIKGRVSLIENRRVYIHRLCLLFSKSYSPVGTPRKIPLHNTTDKRQRILGVGHEKRRSIASFRLKTKPAGISWVLSFFLDRIYKKWYNKAAS